MADSEHNVKININGDAHWAVNAFNRVKSTLLSVKAAVSQLMSAFGMFGMAMQGIQAVINGYKWLKDKIGETAREAAKLRKEMADASLARRIEREAEKYEKLNKALARTIQLEKERRDILEGRRKAEQSLDDADQEFKKQKEIATLDPNDKDYAEKKAEIERKYALAALDRKDKAASDDNRAQREALREQAGDKDKEQKLKQREADSKYATYEQASAAYFSRWNRQIFRGTSDPEEKKQMEEDKKKVEDIRKAWEKINDEAKKLGHEADVLRQKAAELVGGNMKEKIKNDAERAKIENDRREKAAEKEAKDKKEAEEKKREEERKRKEEDEAKYKVEDATIKRQMEEELYALDPKSKTYDFDRKEIERKYAAAEAERNVRRAKDELDRLFPEDEEIKKKKDAAIAALDPKSDTYESDKNEIEREYDTRPSDNTGTRSRLESDLRVAEEELAVLNLRNTAERRKEMTEADLRKADELESFSARAAAADGVSQNRLTAMGLGSGVSADGKIQSEMRTVIGILKETLKATRDNKPVENNSVSVYGE